MQSESDKEMQLRKEQRIREAEAETMKLRRELDEMRDAREKQMSLFKALNERCESFKAQLQHRSPAVSAPAVDVTDSPLFQQLLQDKEKLQAEFDAFKEARFSTSRDEIEKLRIMDWLHLHTTDAKFTVRHKWNNGDLAIWDNRSTQHYALNDYSGFRRELHRTTVAGTRPAQ